MWPPVATAMTVASAFMDKQEFDDAKNEHDLNRLEQKVIWIENEIKERGASYNTMLTFVRQREELLNERLYNSLKDRAGVLKADVVDGQKKIDKLIAFKSAQTEKISKIRAKMHELLESLKDLEGPKEESDA
nr:hypothetical protein Itr_chr03CG10920 [Ipomoea trifida]